jgi:hypothetical protein
MNRTSKVKELSVDSENPDVTPVMKFSERGIFQGNFKQNS